MFPRNCLLRHGKTAIIRSPNLDLVCLIEGNIYLLRFWLSRWIQSICAGMDSYIWLEALEIIVEGDKLPVPLDAHGNPHFADFTALFILNLDVSVWFVGDLSHFMADPLLEALHMNKSDGSLAVARSHQDVIRVISIFSTETHLASYLFFLTSLHSRIYFWFLDFFI